MIKLRKFMKPFLAGLLLAVALLLIQAVCDLNLPNYMSDIVNIGIQQGGVEQAAPDAISEDGMALMVMFMDDGERETVAHAYRLVARTDTDDEGRVYGTLYPGMGEGLYVKDGRDAALDGIFGAASYRMVTVMSAMAERMGVETSDSVDVTVLYAVLPMLAESPELQSLFDSAESRDVPDMITEQTGVMMARAFYQELGVDMKAMQDSYVLKIGLLMLMIAMAGGLASVLVSYLSSRIATGVARDLRRDLFNKVESFSHDEFDKFSTASLITRCTNDITQVQMLLLMGIRLMCYAPLMGIGGVLMAIEKSVSMSWIIIVAVVTLLGLVCVMMSIALPRFKIIQKLTDRLNLVSREALSGLMVIRAFGTDEHEEQRFDEANRDLTKVSLFINRVMVVMMPAMMLIMNGISLLIIWVGARHIADSTLQIGDMMAFIQYSMHIIISFLMISMMFIMIPRAAVSGARIAEVLETGLAIQDPPVPKDFCADKKGWVEFRDVRFRYRGAEADAVTGITFTAKPGQTTAIIGSTGSGKSTVVNLIMRFYDVSGGQILVSGVDVRDVRQRDLREKIGYVPQKGVLLSGTVASNLRYGRRDASDAEIEEAARVAQASGFIGGKEGGYEAEIAQGGGNISGGQKQRLSIARALAKRPEILIFDDSFSALDFKTDAALRKALWEHTTEAAVIVVAQRVGTIMNAERILVLDEGRIVGDGTHRELMKNCPAYAEIAASQLSEEELA